MTPQTDSSTAVRLACCESALGPTYRLREDERHRGVETSRYDQSFEFIDTITNSRPCGPSLREGVMTQAVIDAAQQSHAARKWVDVQQIWENPCPTPSRAGIPRQTRYSVMAQINGDALRGHLETLILSALRRGEAHGFEILRRLEAAGSGALRLKEGSLYPAIYRLESAGLIKGAWEGVDWRRSAGEATRRGPRRRMYCLTTKGRRRLDTARAEFDQFVTVIGNILGAAS